MSKYEDIVQELLNKIDAETKKSERLAYCAMIDAVYKSLLPAMAPYVDVLNSTVAAKYIFQYMLVVFGYGKEVSELQKSGWNNSVVGLTRNLLECYAYAKNLIGLYGTPAYEDYIKNLIVIDMEQDRKIYNSIISDNSITDKSQRDADAKSYIMNMEDSIKRHFPAEALTISEQNKADSVISIVKSLKTNYFARYSENAEKHTLVASAICKNTLISGFEGAEVVYRIMCHHTHNNVTSLNDRTIKDGVIMMNSATKDLLPCVQFAYFCMKDCFDEFMKILATISGTASVPQ